MTEPDPLAAPAPVAFASSASTVLPLEGAVSSRSSSPRPAASAPTPTDPSTYLTLSLVAFALVGLEIPLLALESSLDLPLSGFGTAVLHWVVTATLWGAGSVLLLLWACRRTDLSRRRVRQRVRQRGTALRWVTIASLIVVTIAIQWVLRGGILPPVAESAALSQRFEDLGALAWSAQMVYYAAEVAVVLAIVVFGQLAGERWTGRRWVPWGGIVLACTWGLVHVLTQDLATGAYGVGLSLVMGVVFLLTGRRVGIAYVLLLVLFVV